jgi:Flp pilus assembly pilin Flp
MLGFRTLRRLGCREDGVTSIEYGIIASLIGVVIIAAVSSVGTELDRTFSSIAGAFPQQQTEDPNKFPDPCEEGGDNCGGDD